MTIGVVSDIHGNRHALEAVVADVRAQGVDLWWALGDLVAVGPDPVPTVELLADLPGVRVTRGNTERYVLTDDRPPPHPADVIAEPALFELYGIVQRSFAWTGGALAAHGWRGWLGELPLEVRAVLADGTRVLGVQIPALTASADGPYGYMEQGRPEVGGPLRALAVDGHAGPRDVRTPRRAGHGLSIALGRTTPTTATRRPAMVKSIVGNHDCSYAPGTVTDHRRIRWAPMLPAAKLVRLYEANATGLLDDELLDDVGWRLWERLSDVVRVTSGRVRCPSCDAEFQVRAPDRSPDEIVSCPGCDWTVTPRAWHKSWEHHDLNGPCPEFQRYVDCWPAAQSSRDRMLLIDAAVHALHVASRADVPGNFGARNFLEGSRPKIVALLDELAHGPGSHVAEGARARWQAARRLYRPSRVRRA